MDGTFKWCSKQFCRIYTIHVNIEFTDKEINVIPVILVLLPNKTKTT